MSTTTQEEIRIGALTIRPRIEGDESGGTVAIHEFDKIDWDGPTLVLVKAL